MSKFKKESQVTKIIKILSYVQYGKDSKDIKTYKTLLMSNKENQMFNRLQKSAFLERIGNVYTITTDGIVLLTLLKLFNGDENVPK